MHVSAEPKHDSDDDDDAVDGDANVQTAQPLYLWLEQVAAAARQVERHRARGFAHVVGDALEAVLLGAFRRLDARVGLVGAGVRRNGGRHFSKQALGGVLVVRHDLSDG